MASGVSFDSDFIFPPISHEMDCLASRISGDLQVRTPREARPFRVVTAFLSRTELDLLEALVFGLDC